MKTNPYHNESAWKGASATTFSRARELRHRLTPAEQNLWQVLRKRQMKGFKFRRQHPILYYIADFYCHEAKLIIEVDGAYHSSEEQQAWDEQRDKDLAFQGLQVLRFTNQEVLEELHTVVERIGAYLDGIE